MVVAASSRPAPLPHTCCVVVGKESTGKSQLIASLTGTSCQSENFRGSTVDCEHFEDGEGRLFVDTPGIFRSSDTETTRLALDRLQDEEVVLLVVQATHVDEDLADMLPLVQGKRGAIVATFWDKLPHDRRREAAVRDLSAACGVPLIPVDARRLDDAQRREVYRALADPESRFLRRRLPVRAGWRVEPPPTWLEHRRAGAPLATLLLLAPAVLAVWFANRFAGLVDPLVASLLAPLTSALETAPALLRGVLIGRYGFVTMGPLLFVWAVPTVAVYALGLGLYKASGLLDRITVALHPWMRRIGLTGRDLVRVVMGFGCNVPAVISTRACSGCSRPATMTAIAFGSACSYQLGATLAVFAAIGRAGLVAPYLLYLALTTLLVTRLSAGREARSPLNVLTVDSRAFLSWPSARSVWREGRGVLLHFFRRAVPIFLLITLVASLLDWLGVIDVLAGVLAPAMALFGLPPEAALAVVMASIRKDGILLFAEPGTAAALSAGQVLVGVYLAGVLLPCLVTALTIAREASTSFALRLVARQATAAVVFALILAWTMAPWLR